MLLHQRLEHCKYFREQETITFLESAQPGFQQPCSGSSSADHNHLFSATNKEVWGGGGSRACCWKPNSCIPVSNHFSLMRKDMNTDRLKAHQSVERRLPHASKERNMRQIPSLLSSSTLVHELGRLILWERERNMFLAINLGRLLFHLLQEGPAGYITMAVHGQEESSGFNQKTLTATNLAAASCCTSSTDRAHPALISRATLL